MKKLLVSDTHLGLNKDNPKWHDVTLLLFEEIKEFCDRENIEEVYHLGDFFDNPKIITQKAYDVAMRIADHMKDRMFYIIRGNHDTFHKDRPNPNWVNIFNEYKNIVTVTDKCLVVDNIGLVPWEIDFRGIEVEYLFGHFEINTFFYNDYKMCTNAKLNIKDFEKFESIYSGHFHNKMDKENIFYIGSPFQQNFGDSNSIRGYSIFDNGKLSFVEFTRAPKFIKIRTDEDIKNIEEVVKNNIVKLIYVEDYGTTKNSKILSSIEEMSPLSVSIDMSQIMNEEKIKQEEGVQIKSSKDILIEYLNEMDIPEVMNKKVLIDIAEKLVKEIQ